MRILNLDGAYFVSEFKRLGHEVLSIGPGKGHDIVLDSHLPLGQLQDLLRSKGFTPDLILWCDAAHPPYVFGIEHFPAPTIAFSIDQYCNPWHVPYSGAFDLVLVAQKDYVPLFEHEGLERRIRWFPLFCKNNDLIPLEGERDIPVSFVGTVDGFVNRGRKAFLDAFRKLAPLYVGSGTYQPVYGRSRIVLNQCAAAELNFRLFEAAACGAAVLTEDVDNGLRDLFEPGRHILVYPSGDAEAAASLAMSALEDPERLSALAHAGAERVRALHSVRNRAQTILLEALSLLKRQSWLQRREKRDVIRTMIAKAFVSLATDIELPLPDSLRNHYAQIANLHLR